MKYAVIGAGYWGENHVRVAAELEEEGLLDSVVICDVDEQRVGDLSERYGLEQATDYQTLPDRGVDAATVATPSTTHHEIATDLLSRGVDLLVEKPLALSSDDAWDIVDAAETNGRTLGVGHIFRYHPALNELKKRIDRGELGQLKYLQTNRFSFRVPRDTTGALYSLAVHDIDIYNYLMDAVPDRAYCTLDSFVREEIDETATLVLEYGDTTGIIHESWQMPVFGKRRDLVVAGTERSAYVDYLEDTVLELHDARIASQDGEHRTVEEGSTTLETESREPLRAEVEDFLDACETDRAPRANGVIGARTVELLEVAIDSDEREEVVDL